MLLNSFSRVLLKDFAVILQVWVHFGWLYFWNSQINNSLGLNVLSSLQGITSNSPYLSTVAGGCLSHQVTTLRQAPPNRRSYPLFLSVLRKSAMF